MRKDTENNVYQLQKNVILLSKVFFFFLKKIFELFRKNNKVKYRVIVQFIIKKKANDKSKTEFHFVSMLRSI